MTPLPLRLASIVFAAAGTLAAPAALAQAFDAVRLNAAPPGRDGGVAGVLALAGSEYRGSDERRTLVLPLLDYQWASGWFAGVSNGVGYNFSGSPQMQYGLRLSADLGRKEKRSSALRGMGDIDAQPEAGAFFNHQWQQGFAFSSSARFGSGEDGKGLLVDLGLGYSTALGSSWRLGVGTAVTLANAEYMQAYFGVAAAQAVRSGYAVYTPKAGARDARASVSLTYSVTPRLRITGAVSASTLLGDAQDSPLTRQKTTGSGLVAVGYAF